MTVIKHFRSGTVNECVGGFQRDRDALVSKSSAYQKIKKVHGQIHSIPLYSTTNCAGNRCQNLGKILLKVRYVNKLGMFCELCAQSLVNGELADEVLERESIFIETNSQLDPNLVGGRTN